MIGLFKENKMFRILLGYQLFSTLGGGVFQIFMLLSVHLLYQNPIYTGIAGFLMAAPFIFSFAVGPVVDRRSKPMIMRLTTLLEFVVMALLAFTPVLEQTGVLFLFAVILIFSAAAVFESPAGGAMLPQIVQGEKILQAKSFIQIVSFVGMLVIVAVLYTSLGAGADANFAFIYGLSAGFLILAFVFALLTKDPAGKEMKDKSKEQSYLQDLKDGARFLRQNFLLYIVIAVVSLNLFSEIASVNRPMFFEYYVGVQGYIILGVIAIIGGIAASVLIGVLGNNFRVGRMAAVLLLIAGVVRIIFVQVIPFNFAITLAILFLYSTFSTVAGTVFSTLKQRVPPKDMIGRVDTISTTFIAIFTALGALAGGFLGNMVPVVDHIFIYQSIGYLAIGVAILLIPSIRKLPKMDEINKTGVNFHRQR